VVDPLGLDRVDRLLDWLETALDAGGLVPGFGEPLDLLNAGVRLARGGSCRCRTVGSRDVASGWAGGDRRQGCSKIHQYPKWQGNRGSGQMGDESG